MGSFFTPRVFDELRLGIDRSNATMAAVEEARRNRVKEERADVQYGRAEAEYEKMNAEVPWQTVLSGFSNSGAKGLAQIEDIGKVFREANGNIKEANRQKFLAYMQEEEPRNRILGARIEENNDWIGQYKSQLPNPKKDPAGYADLKQKITKLETSNQAMERGLKIYPALAQESLTKWQTTTQSADSKASERMNAARIAADRDKGRGPSASDNLASKKYIDDQVEGVLGRHRQFTDSSGKGYGKLWVPDGKGGSKLATPSEEQVFTRNWTNFFEKNSAERDRFNQIQDRSIQPGEHPEVQTPQVVSSVQKIYEDKTSKPPARWDAQNFVGGQMPVSPGAEYNVTSSKPPPVTGKKELISGFNKYEVDTQAIGNAASQGRNAVRDNAIASAKKLRYERYLQDRLQFEQNIDYQMKLKNRMQEDMVKIEQNLRR